MPSHLEYRIVPFMICTFNVYCNDFVVKKSPTVLFLCMSMGGYSPYCVYVPIALEIQWPSSFCYNERQQLCMHVCVHFTCIEQFVIIYTCFG